MGRPAAPLKWPKGFEFVVNIRAKSLLIALVFVISWVPLRNTWGAQPPTNGTVRVGDMAPDFELESLSGERLSLSERLDGKPVLIVFWSYFCFPCQKEVPDVEQVYRELGPDQLTVVGVSLDGPQYDQKVLPFLKSHDITFPVAYDRETEEFFETAEKYGVVGTPTSFVLDLQGRVRFIQLGRLDPDVLKGVIQSARDPSYCAEITKVPSKKAP